MSFIDLLIVPVYLLFMLGIVYMTKSSLTNNETSKYFIPAFLVKILGAISLGLIYYFYYGGGDTVNYYRESQKIYKAILDEPSIGFRLALFTETGDITVDSGKYTGRIYWYLAGDSATFFVIRVTSILSIISFGFYSAISMFFALFSFFGTWRLYQTMCHVYPNLKKQMSYAVLFVPSVFFWGSGLMKDTLTFGAMGFFVYNFYFLFIAKKFSLMGIVSLILNAFLIYKIKDYILICLVPSMMIWLFYGNLQRIKNKFLRTVVAPFLMVLGIGAALYVSSALTSNSKRYNAEEIAKTSRETAEWLSYSSKKDEGSGYELSEIFDGSMGSLVRVAPQAFVVTFFRPFLWEARNPVMMLSALESLFILFLFIRTLVKRPKLDAYVAFAFVFSTIFGIAIGMSTYNFGSLVRYKIPALVYFLTALVVLNYDKSKLNDQKDK